MKRQKGPSETVRFGHVLVLGLIAFSVLLAPPASADIYRWEDEGGVIHFTDDPSAIPSKYKQKAREILKAPPAFGQPSLSTMGDPASSPGSSSSPRSSNGEASDRPTIPPDDDATLVEKLRAKIDAKERFLRDVDQKQSLAVNPYRNRFVSPPDLELYGKYKEELPRDRERLKELESRLPPLREP
ncbi:MAG TPA: DUF4124 domain-containing protein [Candidatus Methylomirabilis sp.]|nr:DUF4124 domain-containing protein [Candidatus Methylomirabilis sp.]